MTVYQEQWIADYEAAYFAANGKPARVVAHGGGWYRIAPSDFWSSRLRLRKSQILAMTANLERRASEEKE